MHIESGHLVIIVSYGGLLPVEWQAITLAIDDKH